MSTCSVCDKRAPHNCAKCEITSYCSRECQKLDWPSHKINCPKIKAADMMYKMMFKHIEIMRKNAHNSLEINISEIWDDFGNTLFAGYPHIAIIKQTNDIANTKNKKTCKIIFKDITLEKILDDKCDLITREECEKTIYFEIN